LLSWITKETKEKRTRERFHWPCALAKRQPPLNSPSWVHGEDFTKVNCKVTRKKIYFLFYQSKQKKNNRLKIQVECAMIKNKKNISTNIWNIWFSLDSCWTGIGRNRHTPYPSRGFQRFNRCRSTRRTSMAIRPNHQIKFLTIFSSSRVCCISSFFFFMEWKRKNYTLEKKTINKIWSW
jgi:hypothetical protein